MPSAVDVVTACAGLAGGGPVLRHCRSGEDEQGDGGERKTTVRHQRGSPRFLLSYAPRTGVAVSHQCAL